MKDINKLGEKIVKRLATFEGLKNDVEGERQDIGTELRIIWEALESGQTVNGATNKKEWCAFAKIAPRYAQYLVKDGSRKNQTRTVVRVLDGMKIGLLGFEVDAGEGSVSVDFDKERIDTYKGKAAENRGDWSDKAGVWQHPVREISGQVSFDIEDATLTQEQVIVELLKKMKSGLKALHLWDDKLVAEYKEYVKEYLEYEADRKEDRSRSAKKAAETRKKKAPVKVKQTPAGKSVANLDKFRAQKVHAKQTFAERSTVRTQTVGGFFAYYDPKRDAKGEKPWVLVIEGATKAHLGYRRTREDAEELVKEKAKDASQTRFLAQEETAAKEEHTGQHEDCPECFEAVMAKEALDKLLSFAWKQWSKRLQTLINTWRNGRLHDADKYRVAFDKASEKYVKAVKRIISKTKAVVAPHQLSTETIVNEARGRMEGAIADKKRLEAQHPAAKALAAAVDGTELSWSQKVCIPGSPEREQWRKDLAWRREHPPIDPNEGDEFEGEGD